MFEKGWVGGNARGYGKDLFLRLLFVCLLCSFE
jgi:hypothetical protein